MEEKLDEISRKLTRFIDKIGKFSTFAMIPLVLITIWDVICRKLVWVQIWLVENISPYLGSTILQELEWHFHTILFLMVFGYGFIHNRHVRVDFIRENFSFRKQAWIDFLGTTFFMIPFCVVIIYFSFIYVKDSFVINEASASMVGLPYRWVIKSFLLFGFTLALLSGISVWLQTFICLFGRPDYRFDLMTLTWPEEKNQKAQDLEDMEKTLDTKSE